MGRRPTLGPLYGRLDARVLPRYPQVLLRGRREGKTTHALSWVQRGVRVPGYPGWSRVLVVPDVKTEMTMRSWPAPDSAVEYAHAHAEPYLSDTTSPDFNSWWSCIPDWSHRVYDYRTWAGAHGVRPDTEVRVDEINLLWDFLQLPGTVTGFTMTGETWEPESD